MGDSNPPCKEHFLYHLFRKASLPWAVFRALSLQPGDSAKTASPEWPHTILAPHTRYCPMSFLLSNFIRWFRLCFFQTKAWVLFLSHCSRAQQAWSCSWGSGGVWCGYSCELTSVLPSFNSALGQHLQKKDVCGPWTWDVYTIGKLKWALPLPTLISWHNFSNFLVKVLCGQTKSKVFAEGRRRLKPPREKKASCSSSGLFCRVLPCVVSVRKATG